MKDIKIKTIIGAGILTTILLLSASTGAFSVIENKSKMIYTDVEQPSVVMAEDDIYEITVNVTNIENTGSPYGGRLRVYVVEPDARWKDDDNKDYQNGFLDFASNHVLSIDYLDTHSETVIWDASDEGWSNVEVDNIMVIAVVFNPERHQGYSDPPTGAPFDAHYVDAAAAATPGTTGYNTVNEDFTHTVFSEEGTTTWCPNCPTVNSILHEIYNSQDYPFYYAAMVTDMNPSASAHMGSTYSLYWVPTCYYDGGYSVVVGGYYESIHRNSIENSGARDVHELDVEISLEFIGNHAPDTPSNPFPEDGLYGVDFNADLSWTSGDPDGDSVTYDVYFGDSDPPPLVSPDQTETTYDPGTLDYESYYWQIVAKDDKGEISEGPIWFFSTMINNMVVENATAVIGETGKVIHVTGSWSIELGAYQMALFYDTDQIEVVDITFDGTLGATAAFTPINISTPGMAIAAAVWMPPGFPCPPPGSGMLCNVIINIKPGADLGETILDLDHYLGEPSVKCKYTPPGGGAGDEVIPELIDGVLNIIFGVCGDADGSGDVDIDDVVYLINYIFAGGPAPDPLCLGDADASGDVDIDDVVYLINYIFAGGPEPDPNCCGD